MRCCGTSERIRQEGFQSGAVELGGVRTSSGLLLPTSGAIWCGQGEGNVGNVCDLLGLRSMKDIDGRTCLCSGQWFFQLWLLVVNQFDEESAIDVVFLEDDNKKSNRNRERLTTTIKRATTANDDDNNNRKSGERQD
jgi:hypothetical protein